MGKKLEKNNVRRLDGVKGAGVQYGECDCCGNDERTTLYCEAELIDGTERTAFVCGQCRDEIRRSLKEITAYMTAPEASALAQILKRITASDMASNAELDAIHVLQDGLVKAGVSPE